MSDYFIYTDGGSRGNPGTAGAGFVVYDQDAKEIYSQSKKLGIKTNNEAEYLAFLLSLDWVEKQVDNQKMIITNQISKEITVNWFSDSKLLVEQINKRYKINQPHLLTFCQTIWSRIARLNCNSFVTYIPREKNFRADQLANQAMNQ